MAEPHDESAARRARALPTRDDLIAPTRDIHNRKKVEDAERMSAFYIERAEQLRRQQGLAPMSEDEKQAIRAEYGLA